MKYSQNFAYIYIYMYVCVCACDSGIIADMHYDSTMRNE